MEGFGGGISGCGKVGFVTAHPKEVFPVSLAFCLGVTWSK